MRKNSRTFAILGGLYTIVLGLFFLASTAIVSSFDDANPDSTLPSYLLSFGIIGAGIVAIIVGFLAIEKPLSSGLTLFAISSLGFVSFMFTGLELIGIWLLGGGLLIMGSVMAILSLEKRPFELSANICMLILFSPLVMSVAIIVFDQLTETSYNGWKDESLVESRDIMLGPPVFQHKPTCPDVNTCYSARSVSCPNSNTCFIAGSAMIGVTRDSGKTWQSEYFSKQSSDYDRYNKYRVLVTNDGGQSWKKLFEPPKNQETTTLQQVVCPDINTCFVLGVIGYIYGSNTRLWSSWDSGITWSEKVIEGAKNINCPSSQVCYIVGLGGTFSISSDSGKTWVSQAKFTNLDLYEFSCFDASTCYTTDDQQFFTTHDGGLSWTKQPFPSGLKAWQITCPTLTNCYVTGRVGKEGSKIVATYDAGKTWVTEYETRVQAKSIYGVSCPAVNTCFAAGWQYNFLTKRS